MKMLLSIFCNLNLEAFKYLNLFYLNFYYILVDGKKISHEAHN